MKRTCIVTLAFIFLTNIVVFAAKTVHSTGTGDEEITENISVAEAKKLAEEKATIDALERAFGKAIIQGNTTYIQNINNGQKVETHSGFNMISNTFVKGEVVEVLDRKFEEKKGLKIIEGKKVEYSIMVCEITVKAKEYEEPPIEFSAEILGCEDLKCKADRFKNDDPMYISFRTPTPGYVAIYMDDNKTASILLPYETNRNKFPDGFPVEMAKDYVFFSAKNADINGGIVPDQLQLFTNETQELNRVFIIFSKTPIVLLDVKETTSGNPDVKLPYSTPSEQFQKWLTKSKIKNKLSVKVADVIITKK